MSPNVRAVWRVRNHKCRIYSGKVLGGPSCHALSQLPQFLLFVAGLAAAHPSSQVTHKVILQELLLLCDFQQDFLQLNWTFSASRLLILSSQRACAGGQPRQPLAQSQKFVAEKKERAFSSLLCLQHAQGRCEQPAKSCNSLLGLVVTTGQTHTGENTDFCYHP